MKKLMILLAAAALLPLSCKEKPGPDQGPASILIEVSDISTRNASVSISCTGPAPTLVRMTDPVLKADYLEAVGIGQDENTVIKYIKTTGYAVSVPFTSAMTDLYPSQDYVIGAISFDGNLDMQDWKIYEFRTADLGSATVGDPSGAGSLTDNQLTQ